jgi:hypothetical protein
MRRAILKIKEGLAHLSFGLIYDLKDNLKNVFVRKSLVRRWRFFVEMRALNTGTLGTGTVYWYRYPYIPYIGTGSVFTKKNGEHFVDNIYNRY